MKLSVIARGPVTSVQCEGEITQLDVTGQENPLVTLLGASCFESKVLFGMERVVFVDSAGIGWLVMSHKSFRDAGGKLVLRSLPPMVHELFRLLRLTTVLNLADSEEAGMKMLE